MTDPRMLGALNLIERRLGAIAASLERIAAKLDASLVAAEPAEPEGTDPDEELR